MSTNVDTVEERIQKAILTAKDSIVALKIKLAISSINASSRQDATSVTANSERVEHSGVNSLYANESEKNKTPDVLCTNDETRRKIP